MFNRPLVAEEDIVCYKQLYVNYNGEIVTPYTNFLYLQSVYKKNKKKRIPFKAEIVNKWKFIWRHVFGFSNVVADGFIHTFSSAPLYQSLGRGNRVFQCIIPKGTKYFIGIGEHEYASEQIIFGDRLK